MSSVKLPMRTKLALAARNVLGILRRPTYAIVAIISAFIFMTIVIWSLNYQLVGYVLFEAPLSASQKLQFFTYGYQSLFTTYDNMLSLSVLLVSVLFGVNVSVLVYAFRRQFARLSGAGASSAAAVFGLLSSGCAACGTSLLGPVLATFGATSIAAVHTVGAALNLVGAAILLYVIYRTALQTPSKA